MNTDELKELLEKRTQEEWKAVYEDRSGYWIASWDSSCDGGFEETDAKLMALAPKLAEKLIALEGVKSELVAALEEAVEHEDSMQLLKRAYLPMWYAKAKDALIKIKGKRE